MRERPFLVNNEAICTPDERELLETDGSYPSGHSALAGAGRLFCRSSRQIMQKRFWRGGAPMPKAAWSVMCIG